MTAIEYLLHLHSCEQEGISSGMPTPQQWIDAVEAARNEYASIKLKEQQWVSVKERLPENRKEVLVYSQFDEIPWQARYIDGEWHVSREVIENAKEIESFRTEAICQQCITHWMPLPTNP